MPKISRLFLKTGIVYLVVSILLFLMMQLPEYGISQLWWPVFYHMLMVGWITQVIFGVAIWMFPRMTTESRDTRQRLGTKGSMAGYYTVYALLNIGLLLPVHVSTMVFGWMLQFVLGVAYWMLPKFRQEPRRGRVLPAKVSLFALNTGVIISSAGHLSPALGISPSHAAALQIAGYLLAAAGVATVALLISPRILSYRGDY